MDDHDPNALKVVGWAIVIACFLGLMMRGCDRAPDYGCHEVVTPWGVECE